LYIIRIRPVKTVTG